MSSTNRGGQRIANDQYFTPSWCVDRLLERVTLPGGRWLEPCAGDGAIIKAVQAARSERWAAIEIDEKHLPELRNVCRTTFPGDARERVKEFTNVDVCITNPPFSIAQEILEACLATGALCVFLQRLNWCEGLRAELFQKLKPSVYVIPDRISFVNGKCDSVPHAWWVFDGKGKFEILNKTPLEIRRIKKKNGVDKTSKKKLTVHRVTRANENANERTVPRANANAEEQSNAVDEEKVIDMAFLPPEMAREAARAKPSEGFERLTDGKYLLLHKGMTVENTEKGQAVIIAHEVVESEVLVEGIKPLPAGTHWGLFLPIYGDAKVMLMPNLSAYVLGLLGLKKGQVDENELEKTIRLIGGEQQAARGMLIRAVTYHKQTRAGDDFMGQNWTAVSGENIIGAPSVLARRTKLDGGISTSLAAPPSLAAAPALPAITPPIPNALSGLEALVAQGWQPHPSNPAYMWRGSEAKLKTDLLAQAG
jgi:hypothetical protein